jgi:hypothetical protein
LHDGPKRDCIDGDARSLGDDDDKSAFELEIGEERKIVDTLSALCQLGEDQETPPSLAVLSQSNTLEDGSQGLEVAFRDAARANNAPCSDPSVDQEDVRKDDADGKDPLGHVMADLRLDLAGPLVEGEEVDGREGVGGVDGN